jgi:membrane protein DedA with SNARE-associated domain
MEIRPDHRLCGRAALRFVVPPLVLSVAAGTAANALAPVLVTRHPLLLILLNPRLRYLVLASPRVSVLTFFLVSVARLCGVDMLSYLLGRWCGDAALAWIESRTKRGRRLTRTVERWFTRAAPAATFLFPSGPISLMAGWTDMAAPAFLGLVLGGTVLRVIAVRIFATVFDAELADVLRFIGRNEEWLVALTLSLAAVQALLIVRSLRARRPTGPEGSTDG